MTRCWRRYGFQLAIASSVLVGGGAISSLGDCVLAQITPDGTLPNNSIVTPQSNTSVIEGGTQKGSNLFHSFDQFSVPTGNVAQFNNGLDIQNIFNRVTGKSISNIDGSIRANGTANLFLLNPNGIIFGPNARLDIGGSFLGSTASSLNFADGTKFSATVPQATRLLTVNVPLGLQFGGNAGSILNQSQATNSSGEVVGLQVLPGKTLGLVGGNVSLDGGILQAPGGRVELGGVAGTGTVGLQVDGSNLRLSFPDGVARADVLLTNQALVGVSGADDGDTQVQGRHVIITAGSQIGSQIVANLPFNSPLRPEPGGNIAVFASESVELYGTSVNGQFSSGLFTNTQGSKIAGDIRIVTGRLIVRDGAQVSAATFGAGDGGTLYVSAKDSVELLGASADRSPSGLFTQASGDGAAGDLRIVTGWLSIRDGAQVSASTFGQGRGGDLTVNAADFVQLFGASADGTFSGGLFTQAQGTGNAGNLTIGTRQLNVLDRAEASVSSRGSGNAGNLTTTADSIFLGNQGKLTAESASGQGGNIDLQARNLLLMRGNSRISAFNSTVGSIGIELDGNIKIDTELLVASENSDIVATGFGRSVGSNIQVNAQSIFGLIERSLEDIKTLLGTDNPNELNPNRLPSSDILATGTVELNTLYIDPSQGLATLPAELVEASGLITSSCAAVGENEFTITGRGGLLPSPNEVLSSDAVWVDWGTLKPRVENSSRRPVSTNPTATEPAPIVEARGWVINDKGEVMLTATAPNVTPHSPWISLATCHTPQASS